MKKQPRTTRNYTELYQVGDSVQFADTLTGTAANWAQGIEGQMGVVSAVYPDSISIQVDGEELTFYWSEADNFSASRSTSQRYGWDSGAQFQVGQLVYIPSLQAQGKIEAINPDGTLIVSYQYTFGQDQVSPL